MTTKNQSKFIISSQGTIIGKAIVVNALVSNYLIRLLLFITWILGIGSLLVLISGAVNFVDDNNFLYGWAYIILGLFVIYLSLRIFYISKIKYPRPLSLKYAILAIKKGQNCNLFRVFSFELARVWIKKVGDDFSRKNVGNVLGALLESKDSDFILYRMGISKKSFRKIIASLDYKKDIVKIILRSLQIAEVESHHQIEVGDVFCAIVEGEPKVKRFFFDLGFEIEDILNIVYWQTNVIRADIKRKRKLFDPDDLHLTGGIGRDWTFGYTPLLNQYSFDLTQSISQRGLGLKIIGHEKEIKELEEALARQKGGNVVLVGEAGVGKDTTILGFADRVYKGASIGELKNKHVIKIDIDALLAGAHDAGEITERISGILAEASRAGNIIMYIENINNLFSAGDAGKVNATEVIIPYLEAVGVHIVGTCDETSYNRHIATNSSLTEKFTKVKIEEPTKKEMIRILEDVVPQIEYHTKSLITYGAIQKTIAAADKYILNIPNPEKSINLLDGASAYALSERGETIVVAKDVGGYISEKYDVPSSEIEGEEKKKLLDLEKVMHQRVIGQDEAINAIANAMRRSRAGIEDTKKPIGSFLFLGPTGVGKTETSKALAEAYFGDDQKMIRFDMSEYQNKQDIYRLIGSNIQGQEELGVLTTKVRQSPFSLLLFDEIEKAHPDILNLFLQVLDEGQLTDGSGGKVSFTNTIIITTSNAGANLIRQAVQSGVEYQKTQKELIEYLQQENIYRPEFINRFTQVIIFAPLSQEEIAQIASLMIQKLEKSIYTNKGVKLEVTSDAILRLAEMGFDPKMGARPMERAIQDKLENMLAKKIISGQIKKGDKVNISAGDIV